MASADAPMMGGGGHNSSSSQHQHNNERTSTSGLSCVIQLQQYMRAALSTCSPQQASNRKVLCDIVLDNPNSADAWLNFLDNEEACLRQGGASASDVLVPKDEEGAAGKGGGVSLYNLYHKATELVHRSKGRPLEAYVKIWVGYARHQWRHNEDEARDTFKTLKNQHIADSNALLFHAWACLEAESGNTSKALGILTKAMKENAQPASILQSLLAELHSATPPSSNPPPQQHQQQPAAPSTLPQTPCAPMPTLPHSAAAAAGSRAAHTLPTATPGPTHQPPNPITHPHTSASSRTHAHAPLNKTPGTPPSGAPPSSSKSFAFAHSNGGQPHHHFAPYAHASSSSGGHTSHSVSSHSSGACSSQNHTGHATTGGLRSGITGSITGGVHTSTLHAAAAATPHSSQQRDQLQGSGTAGVAGGNVNGGSGVAAAAHVTPSAGVGVAAGQLRPSHSMPAVPPAAGVRARHSMSSSEDGPLFHKGSDNTATMTSAAATLDAGDVSMRTLHADVRDGSCAGGAVHPQSSTLAAGALAARGSDGNHTGGTNLTGGLGGNHTGQMGIKRFGFKSKALRVTHASESGGAGAAAAAAGGACAGDAAAAPVSSSAGVGGSQCSNQHMHEAWQQQASPPTAVAAGSAFAGPACAGTGGVCSASAPQLGTPPAGPFSTTNAPASLGTTHDGAATAAAAAAAVGARTEAGAHTLPHHPNHHASSASQLCSAESVGGDGSASRKRRAAGSIPCSPRDLPTCVADADGKAKRRSSLLVPPLADAHAAAHGSGNALPAGSAAADALARSSAPALHAPSSIPPPHPHTALRSASSPAPSDTSPAALAAAALAHDPLHRSQIAADAAAARSTPPARWPTHAHDPTPPAHPSAAAEAAHAQQRAISKQAQQKHVGGGVFAPSSENEAPPMPLQQPLGVAAQPRPPQEAKDKEKDKQQQQVASMQAAQALPVARDARAPLRPRQQQSQREPLRVVHAALAAARHAAHADSAHGQQQEQDLVQQQQQQQQEQELAQQVQHRQQQEQEQQQVLARQQEAAQQKAAAIKQQQQQKAQAAAQAAAQQQQQVAASAAALSSTPDFRALPEQLPAQQRRAMEDTEWVYVNGLRYQKLDCVGRGGSSKVFKVLGCNRQIYALKRVRLANKDPEAIRGFIDEITLLKQLRNTPNIIQLISAQVFHEECLIYMVLEYGDIDLARLLQNHEEARRRQLASGGASSSSSGGGGGSGGNSGGGGGAQGVAGGSGEIDENFIRLYWQQMLQAVGGIHELRIVHSDLKPANFLLVQGQLKLIDFGIAKSIQGDTTSINRESQVGTLNYMSPEAIQGGSSNPLGGPPLKVGRPSDVWSLGCILYQMVYGQTPFADIPFIPKMNAICNPNHNIRFAPCANPAAADAMARCLDRNPRTRITIPELLDHTFLHPERVMAAAASAPSNSLSEEHLKSIVSQIALAGASGTADIDTLTRQVLAQLKSQPPAPSPAPLSHPPNSSTRIPHAPATSGSQPPPQPRPSSSQQQPQPQPQPQPHQLQPPRAAQQPRHHPVRPPTPARRAIPDSPTGQQSPCSPMDADSPAPASRQHARERQLERDGQGEGGAGVGAAAGGVVASEGSGASAAAASLERLHFEDDACSA